MYLRCQLNKSHLLEVHTEIDRLLSEMDRALMYADSDQKKRLYFKQESLMIILQAVNAALRSR